MQYKLCIHAILFHYSILKVRTFCYKRKKIFTPLHLFILLQNSRILLTYTAAGNPSLLKFDDVETYEPVAKSEVSVDGFKCT